MTPLEAAARAAYESTGLFKWEEVRDKGRLIAAMRAALLALATNGLPEKIIKIGASEVYGYPKVADQIAAFRCFEQMLRAIASEGEHRDRNADDIQEEDNG